MNKLKKITIKTGTANQFMERVKNIMRAADRDEVIESSQTLIFEEPS